MIILIIIIIIILYLGDFQQIKLYIFNEINTVSKGYFHFVVLDDTPLSPRYKALQMDDKESFDQFCQQVGLEKECGEASWNLWESVSSKMSETSKVQEHC